LILIPPPPEPDSHHPISLFFILHSAMSAHTYPVRGRSPTAIFIRGENRVTDQSAVDATDQTTIFLFLFILVHLVMFSLYFKSSYFFLSFPFFLLSILYQLFFNSI
jgi:hypothetical protein